MLIIMLVLCWHLVCHFFHVGLKMAGASVVVVSALLLLGSISLARADTCGKPEVTATSYTTQDATVLTNIAYVAEFSLKCSNAIKGLPLYAEVNGRILPAARTSDDNHYQVRTSGLRTTLLHYLNLFLGRFSVKKLHFWHSICCANTSHSFGLLIFKGPKKPIFCGISIQIKF